MDNIATILSLYEGTIKVANLILIDVVVFCVHVYTILHPRIHVHVHVYSTLYNLYVWPTIHVIIEKGHFPTK